MNWIIGLLFLISMCFQAKAQVNPDDDLIPSQGGANDNPSRHKLYTPTSQNRIVFKRNNHLNQKSIKKKQKELADQRKIALAEFEKKYQSNSYICQVCFGIGIQNCEECKGDGLQECDVCLGVEPEKCKRCGGEGKIFDQTCGLCEGTGLGVCKSCLGVKRSCGTCFGVGYHNCTTCKGVGKTIRNDSIR